MLLFCRRYELGASRNGYTECCDRYVRKDKSSYGRTPYTIVMTVPVDLHQLMIVFRHNATKCIKVGAHKMHELYFVIERFRINIDRFYEVRTDCLSWQRKSALPLSVFWLTSRLFSWIEPHLIRQIYFDFAEVFNSVYLVCSWRIAHTPQNPWKVKFIFRLLSLRKQISHSIPTNIEINEWINHPTLNEEMNSATPKRQTCCSNIINKTKTCAELNELWKARKKWKNQLV